METSGQPGANELFRNIRNSLDACMTPAESEATAFLILEHFGISRTDVVVNRNVMLDNYRLLEESVNRVVSGEPVQYVLGEAWFRGRKFKVGPGVLIPRPETELILEIVKKYPLASGAVVWDLATGSGILAICLSLQGHALDVMGTDISDAALEYARVNARQLEANVVFVRHDLLSGTAPSDQQVDLIVSNPPYIEKSERIDMEDRVLSHEPALALFAPQADSLAFYRSLVEISRKALNPGGRILVEINQRFGREVVTLFEAAGLADVHVERDVSGHSRVVCAVQPAVVS